MGKIALVELGTSDVREFATEPDIADYVGGRVIAARIYWDMVGARISYL